MASTYEFRARLPEDLDEVPHGNAYGFGLTSSFWLKYCHETSLNPKCQIHPKWPPAKNGGRQSSHDLAVEPGFRVYV